MTDKTQLLPVTPELLPCLVEGCQSKPRVQWQGAHIAFVECELCEDTGPLGWTEGEAISGWNARHRISHSLPGDVGKALADPNAVHVNMLRGGIARPSLAQIIHIYGEDAIRAALTPTTPENAS
ncbi:hypothetical protein L7H23_01330 [Sphingopyxis sp. BSN-002]|uniref:hypothetical protein n=1 Tax=Sphingopyxis sp. BSN-002 TaxID=2911495 RepID=UPI001EDC8262|nr:hypothetical protein [Sphingopyxis sp. BSN-002]QVJ07683.1 restriction alleviation protein [Sphingopyxis phage VSN-002]UKK84775.1 hypothetical protein L7H23_01330 [Sphingopyxis sp. BSN-002]